MWSYPSLVYYGWFIYAMGWNPYNSITNQFYRYSISANSWVTKTNTPIDLWYNPVCFVSNNKLYTICTQRTWKNIITWDLLKEIWEVKTDVLPFVIDLPGFMLRWNTLVLAGWMNNKNWTYAVTSDIYFFNLLTEELTKSNTVTSGKGLVFNSSCFFSDTLFTATRIWQTWASDTFFKLKINLSWYAKIGTKNVWVGLWNHQVLLTN